MVCFLSLSLFLTLSSGGDYYSPCATPFHIPRSFILLKKIIIITKGVVYGSLLDNYLYIIKLKILLLQKNSPIRKF